VTGLTSNPSIFDKAIESGDYDAEIRDKAARGMTGEELFFDLALDYAAEAALMDLHDVEHNARDGCMWPHLEAHGSLSWSVSAGCGTTARSWSLRRGFPMG
jgi:transaldolase